MESFLNDPDIKESIRRNLMVQKAAKEFILKVSIFVQHISML